jgi:hypothetical protein
MPFSSDTDTGGFSTHHQQHSQHYQHHSSGGRVPSRADVYPDRDQRAAAGAMPAPAGAAGLSFGTLAAHDAAALQPATTYAPPPCNPAAPAATGGGGGAAHPNSGTPSGIGRPVVEPLPESTPAPVADPAEALMLATYLRLVQETHGQEAAAVAAASSAPHAGGVPPPAPAAHTPPPLASAPRAPSSRPSSRPASAGPQSQPRSGGSAADLGAGDAAAGEVVSNMLGFIRDRKLATNNPPRRTSLGSESAGSSVSSSAGSKGSMKIWIQPSGGAG